MHQDILTVLEIRHQNLNQSPSMPPLPQPTQHGILNEACSVKGSHRGRFEGFGESDIFGRCFKGKIDTNIVGDNWNVFRLNGVVCCL
jgi:hypothetical protein